MKVLFVTQDDPIYVRGFFEELLPMARDRIVVAGVVLAPAMGKRSLSALVAQMYDFYGPVDFVRMGFRYVFLKLGARLPRFIRGRRAYSIEQASADSGVPVTRVSKLNDPEFVASIRAQEIDLVVSVAAPQIFREPLIAAPRLGCINIHNAKLPKYRGMLPNFWQLFHGEKLLGTTVHRISPKLDEGPILAQAETPAVPGESLDQVIRRTKRAGASFLLETIERIRDGQVVECPNNVAEGSYFTFPTRKDVLEFRRRGLRLL
jgi:methionyl-tRNA formyltransferase